MKLGILDGYDTATGQYYEDGEPANLPKNAFVVGNSVPSGYIDSDTLATSISLWDEFAPDLIGSVFGFQDWLALRSEIATRIYAIAGEDFFNWAELTQPEKDIALYYLPTKIIDQKGFSFFATQCGSQQKATYLLDNYISLSATARSKRYTSLIGYGYQILGKAQGLKAENLEVKDFLDKNYIQRGVLYLADDGIDGVGDWIQGTGGYVATGLKPRIITGEFTLPEGLTPATFCNNLISILDGNY